MSIFNRLFHNKPSDNPDNSKLLELIHYCQKEKGAGDTYKNVVRELIHGNSFLMFPTKNESHTPSESWAKTEKRTKINMTSLVNLDGLKVLGAFTDEQSLFNWKKESCQYTAMRSQDVLKFCEENGVSRVVINSGADNMFVLEHAGGNVNEYEIPKDSKILVGVPARPPDPIIMEKLMEGFRKLNAIEEVYLYGQTRDGEFSLILAFRLEPLSEDARKAIINVVRTAVGNHILDRPLDILFIDRAELHNMIKGISNSMIYMKSL